MPKGFKPSKKELEKLYWEESLSINKIAQKLGCSPTKIHYWLKKYEIKRRKSYQKGLNIKKETLEELYTKQKLSLRQIAQRFDCNDTNILYWLKKFNIERRPAYRKKIEIPKSVLKELYWEKGLSPDEIAKKFGIKHGRTVRKKMEKFNIPRRSLSEANTVHPKTPFSGNLDEKAYLLGLRAGDFYAKLNTHTVRVQTTTTHPAQVNMTKKTFGKYSHVGKYTFFNKKRGIEEWFVYCDLDESFKFLLEKPKEIPQWILDDKDLFYHFLAAYMDCEGMWRAEKSHEKHTRFVFMVTNQDLGILKQIKNKLQSEGYIIHLYLKSKKGEEVDGHQLNKDTYDIILYQKEQILSLIKILLPLSKHEEKIKKMKFILDNKEKKWREVKPKWERLKQEIDEGLLQN